MMAKTLGKSCCSCGCGDGKKWFLLNTFTLIFKPVSGVLGQTAFLTK